MKETFDMNTDEDHPLSGTLEVRGTRVRLSIGQTSGAFNDADDVEGLAKSLQLAAEIMRRNGSCPDCGGKGYSVLNTVRVACERCTGQGVVFPGDK